MAEEIKKTVVNYQANSHKSKAGPEKEPKKVEKVVSGEVVQRKKPLGRKIADTFTGDDMQSVGGYILFEVMLPAAKTMISDAVSQGIERLLFGDSRPRGRTNYTSYNRMSGSSATRKDEPRTISRHARATHDFDEIVVESRGEAAAVLDQLTELIDRYNVATVNDLYELVGITGTFADDKWGWTDLRSASVRRVRDGYLLDLPRTSPLD